MNLLVKFSILLLKRIFVKDPVKLTDKCVTSFRVGLFDLDLNFHMNNGRFLSVMDLARFDLLMRAGYFVKLFRNGYFPVVLSESIVFQKSLGYLNRYEVHTQLDSLDKNFFYITQKFYCKNKLVASANVRACFKKRGKKGLVKIADLFDFIGEDLIDQKMSDLAHKQVELDGILFPRDN